MTRCASALHGRYSAGFRIVHSTILYYIFLNFVFVFFVLDLIPFTSAIYTGRSKEMKKALRLDLRTREENANKRNDGESLCWGSRERKKERKSERICLTKLISEERSTIFIYL